MWLFYILQPTPQTHPAPTHLVGDIDHQVIALVTIAVLQQRTCHTPQGAPKSLLRAPKSLLRSQTRPQTAAGHAQAGIFSWERWSGVGKGCPGQGWSQVRGVDVALGDRDDGGLGDGWTPKSSRLFPALIPWFCHPDLSSLLMFKHCCTGVFSQTLERHCDNCPSHSVNYSGCFPFPL